MAFNRSAFHSKKQRKLREKKIAEKLGAEETGILADIWGLHEEKIKRSVRRRDEKWTRAVGGSKKELE